MTDFVNRGGENLTNNVFWLERTDESCDQND